eukprot:s1719_g7.t1
MERFLITQPDGKQRVIDNGRKSGHNQVTQMQETITTVNVDFIATAAQMVYHRLFVDQDPDAEPHPWLRLRLGTDDLPDAYRGLAVCDEHLAFSNIAVYLPNVGWRFTTLYGLAYGLEAAVVAFNRFPQLGIAITRRCLLGMSAAYFDDELSVEFFHAALVTQPALQLVFKLLGAPPQPSKSFVPSANRHYLGTSVHVGEAFPAGVVRFQPKSSTRTKVLTLLSDAIQSGLLERDTASKLRGDLNWMWSMCAGYIGRLAGPVLTAKQTDPSPILDIPQQQTLALLRDVVFEAVPRDVSLRPTPRQLTRIYTDASFEDNVLRLGWIIFNPHHEPTGGTTVVPMATLESWTPRKQQIYPGEALAALVVPLLHPSLLENEEVLWFVDNEAAVTSLIKATSRQLDVHAICQYAHVIAFKNKMRIWFEWIDSASNPSDGLSRLGITDPWTCKQGWNIAEYPFPTQLLPARFFSTFAQLCMDSFMSCHYWHLKNQFAHSLEQIRSYHFADEDSDEDAGYEMLDEAIHEVNNKAWSRAFFILILQAGPLAFCLMCTVRLIKKGSMHWWEEQAAHRGGPEWYHHVLYLASHGRLGYDLFCHEVFEASPKAIWSWLLILGTLIGYWVVLSCMVYVAKKAQGHLSFCRIASVALGLVFIEVVLNISIVLAEHFVGVCKYHPYRFNWFVLGFTAAISQGSLILLLLVLVIGLRYVVLGPPALLGKGAETGVKVCLGLAGLVAFFFIMFSTCRAHHPEHWFPTIVVNGALIYGWLLGPLGILLANGVRFGVRFNPSTSLGGCRSSRQLEYDEVSHSSSSGYSDEDVK